MNARVFLGLPSSRTAFVPHPALGQNVDRGREAEVRVESETYLSDGLRHLKAGALEEPHHLQLQRRLGRQLRPACWGLRLRPARLLAGHGSASGKPGTQIKRVATATAWLHPQRPQGAGPEWVRGRGLASTLSLLLVKRSLGPSEEPVGRGAENPPKDLRTWNGPPETPSGTAGGLAQPAWDLQPTSFPSGRTAYCPSSAGVAPRPQLARVPGSR